jgi:hypothetical protein
VDLREKPREGLQGVYFLFDKISDDMDIHPGIVLSLISYLANPKRGPKPFPVKAEEKKLLFPTVPDIQAVEIQSLDQMFEKFSLEAIFKKEITKVASTRDLTNLLNSVFFGSIITAHLSQINPLKIFMRRHVELAIKGLQ